MGKVAWVNHEMLQKEEIYPCPRPEEQMGNTGQRCRDGRGGMKRFMKKQNFRTGKVGDYFFFAYVFD